MSPLTSPRAIRAFASGSLMMTDAADIFAAFRSEVLSETPLRAAITAAYRRPEPECLPPLLELATASADEARRDRGAGPHFGRSAQRQDPVERGRGPDPGIFAVEPGGRGADVPRRGAAAHSRRRDARRADPRQDRAAATGAPMSATARSLFVNAATWGLVLTGKLVDDHAASSGLSAALTRLIARGGEPLIRARRRPRHAADGRAVRHRPDDRGGARQQPRAVEARGFRYSYDMLGEAAMTAEDAARYFAAYERAIHAIGTASRRARHLRGARHLDQAVGAASALSAAPSATACMAELLPRAESAGRAGAAATTSASTSTPRRPTGSSSRSICSRRSAFDPRSRRLERPRLRRAGLPEALPRSSIDWLVDLARARAAAG